MVAFHRKMYYNISVGFWLLKKPRFRRGSKIFRRTFRGSGVRRGGAYMDAEERSGEVALLIPALDPGGHLIELLRSLEGRWSGPIVLVDDGSGRDARERVFPEAASMGCVVVRHARNLGKGRALKTGFNECLLRWPGLLGAVTADADGQHLPEDILACARRMRERPDALVLGCRNFDDPSVPARNGMGNRITRTFMKLLCGVTVTDTQTGLRGIPASFLSDLLEVPGERFEFETNMLLETRTRQVPISEVPISTVYIEQGRQSHFHPLRDSIRIYALLLKFCCASIVGFCVDIAAFAVFTRLLGPFPLGELAVTAATVPARVLSASVNFLLNRRVVFQSRKRAAGTAGRYAALCVLQMLASAALVTLVSGALPAVPVVGVKVVVDLLLFLLSFQIQRRWVF